MKERKKKLENVLVLVIFTIFLLLIAMWYKAHLFSSTRWINDPDSRKSMVNDLLNKWDLIGMTESEVISLLGSEDSQQSTFKIDRHYYPPESTLTYDIGVDFMETRWLIISLRDGVVDSVSIDVT